jgi:APA family basic amino acid/polyamine antiporter
MVAAAAIAVGFAHYLRYFVDVPLVAGAVGLLVVDAAIAMWGIQRSAHLTVALSAVQVAGLLFVIAIGIPHLGSQSITDGADLGGVVSGAALVFFAFIGFDEVITLAEETRDPTRVIPRALLAALGISAALYMAVAVAAVSVIGADVLAASNRPLADVMAHVMGGRAEAAVAGVALITTMNTSLLALTAASRLMYGMADSGALPTRLASVSFRTRAPTAAIAVASAGAVAFALLGDLTFIASVTDFAVYIVFLAVNATVILLRRRSPDEPRPFRTPGAVRGVPVLPVAGIIAALLMIPQLEPDSLVLGLALLALGAAAYVLVGPARARSHTRSGVG